MTALEKQDLILQLTAVINDMPVDEPAEPDNSKDEKVELLTIKECVKMVRGLSEYTLRKLISSGKIPYIRAGVGANGKMLISKSVLKSYFGDFFKDNNVT